MRDDRETELSCWSGCRVNHGAGPMIRNRYLPMWLHRVCNGVLGAALLAAVGSICVAEPSGTWGQILSRCLLWGSAPAGIVLACFAHRLSVMEGLAGGEGYEELHQPHEHKPAE